MFKRILRFPNAKNKCDIIISCVWWRQATGKLYHLWLRVECTLLPNLQSWAPTYAVLVIGLYDLLEPTI